MRGYRVCLAIGSVLLLTCLAIGVDKKKSYFGYAETNLPISFPGLLFNPSPRRK